MIEVCLLGTGGMMPLPHRWLTSMMLRYNGSAIMVDCGEGTQVALKEKGWSPKPIDVIMFTHFHADHISGLPGMLLTMGNAERTEPLLIVGPKGVERVVESLRVIARDIPFEIVYKELRENEEEFEVCGLRVKAYKVSHNVTCYGYTFELDRAGKFNAERAKAAGIDVRFWNRLQKGEIITTDSGETYTPDMVLGEARKGLKLTYCTDTRPTDAITRNATGSDLFICEGMYGEPDKLAKAKEHKHMTFYEAAQIAKDAEVKELWLTHYSPSLPNPGAYKKEVREIFANTKVAKDGRSIDLLFEE
ncbi:MAG: ribonuclease Z [Lachnospiraceae bacterium]|nr:ribonuclease Z [Candidatus Colinaster equi]